MRGEDIGGVEAKGGAFLLAADIGAEDVVFLSLGVEAVEVAIALPAHIARVEELGV
jgi:hypothetical protein